MASNPFAAQLAKEEKFYSAEISKLLCKAMLAKDIQKKADGLTNQSSKTPPKPVMMVFEKALGAMLKRIASKYAGLVIKASLSYKMKGASWIATAVAQAKYPMVSAGGSVHRIRSGETLWSISQDYYGSGGYWPLLAKANKEGVSSKGDFILSGFPLKIPQIEVIKGISVTPTIEKKVKPVKDAAKPARPIAYPTLEFDLEKSKSVTKTFKFPGMIVIMKTSLKGTLKATKPGILPGGFNLRTFQAEIKKSAQPFETSLKISSFKVTEMQIASNVAGALWKTSISITNTGAVKASFAPKPISFKSNGFVFEGNVGIEVECQIIPDMKKLPEPVPVYEVAFEWVKDNGMILVGGTIIVGAGILVVGTIAEDIITLGAGIADDPVSFALAAGMFRQGMQMVR